MQVAGGRKHATRLDSNTWTGTESESEQGDLIGTIPASLQSSQLSGFCSLSTRT